MAPVPATCKLFLPVVAVSKDRRNTITIPVGATVEVRPTLRRVGLTDVLWEGTWFSAQIDDVLGACHIDDVGKFGWY